MSNFKLPPGRLQGLNSPAASSNRLQASPAAKSVSGPKNQPKAWLFLLVNTLTVISLISFVLVFRQGSGLEPIAISDQPATQQRQIVRPLDRASSAVSAINLAQLAGFEEVYWIAEQAIDAEYLTQVDQVAAPFADKIQLVNTDVKTRKDIIRYVVSDGDSLSSLASSFGVTTNTIRWSNNLTNDKLRPSQELTILPGRNGVVYRVKTNDTISSLLGRYQLNRSALVGFNDLEDELPVDELIFLPEAAPRIVRPIQPAVVNLGYTPLYSHTGYVYGHCTYYVATKIGVPGGLGNANQWDNRAPAHGYTKSKTPAPGAIAQKEVGAGLDGWRYGHVAYVEAVSADGQQIQYSDMNGLAGWNRVGHSNWIAKEAFDWYLIPPS